MIRTNSFISGVVLSAISRYAGIIINLVITAILARVLSPSDFGVIAISMVFITFFTSISESGISSAIVQVKDLTNNNIENLFSVTIFIGIFFSLSLFVSTGLIAKYFNNFELSSIIKYLSISLFFGILNVVPNGLLLKEKRFKFLSIRNIIVQFLCGILSVSYALTIGGIFALVITPVLGNIILFSINYKQFKLIPRVNDIRNSVNKILSFSVFQFLFTLVNYMSRNLDNLLIGKYLGLTSLGFYEKSYRLMLLPISNISNVINFVAHPVLSKFQDDIDEIEVRYNKILIILSSIGFPLSVLLYYNSAFVINFIFGDKWYNSIEIFQILSLSIGFQIVVSSAGTIFQSANMTKLLFFDGVISTVLVIISLVLGIFYYNSLSVTVSFYVVAIIFNFFKSYYILYRFVFNKSLIHLIKKIGIGLLASGFLFVALSTIDSQFDDYSWGRFLLYGFISAILIVFILIQKGIADKSSLLFIYEKFRRNK